MNRPVFFRRLWAAALAAALVCALIPSAFAITFPWSKKEESPSVADFSKNGIIGSIISFESDDFAVKADNKVSLTGITIESLPDPAAGTLVIGGQPLAVGSVVDRTALSGLRFQISQSPTVQTAVFTFRPSFSSGQESPLTTVTLHLLTRENHPPVARNMDLSTYKNVAITGYFDAVDTEGDLLTFQLTSTPARGAVTLAEDGSSQFVYTPYENKTGSDSFTYVALDPAGNTSPEARITVQINKAGTIVTYADLEGSSAHKSAIRLAEEGIYVGQYVDGHYFFEPDAPVSRARFLTMAMAVSGLESMENVTLTGFYDDEAIPTWAKGSVSAALKAGVIQGSEDADGAPVFGADTPVTLAEATVMLNNLLNITDVPVEVFYADNETHWAAQAAANLSVSGVLRPEDMGMTALSAPLTMAETAELLDGALDVMAQRETGWLFR